MTSTCGPAQSVAVGLKSCPTRHWLGEGAPVAGEGGQASVAEAKGQGRKGHRTPGAASQVGRGQAARGQAGKVAGAGPPVALAARLVLLCLARRTAGVGRLGLSARR
jgi:hypothetical protein